MVDRAARSGAARIIIVAAFSDVKPAGQISFVFQGGMAYNGDNETKQRSPAMIYLLLAITCSSLISILMRLSTDRAKANVSMLAMNYLMCLIIALTGTGVGALFPAHPALPSTLLMGAIHGVLYLGSFVLFQVNIRRNGVVLSATFMKLGLLVPMAVSILLFGERPSSAQIFGFALALCAILLVNLEKGASAAGFRAGLLLLLLGGGTADAMSKVYEQWGERTLADQFLLYTFLAAFLLCALLSFHRGERPGRYEILFGFLIGIPNFFSAKFLLAALNFVPAVIAYPTYSVATILAVTLAGVVFFRERLSRRQFLAMGCILAALVLLNL